ncbi:acyltransferase family protein [Peribacillus sp. SCS-155]|uniref:acyltransferase family protein n=1 Tax=Peribacillus sedimenti TaxID=3115297 RepID=UPI0039060346
MLKKRREVSEMIKEWNLLRTIACLSIVFLHSTTQTGRAVGYPEIEHYNMLRTALCYATPTFIVLSEIILANRYPDRLPEKFWSKRFKWIFAPYAAFAIIDAFVTKHFTPGTDLGERIFLNLVMGNYEGYFILIIFQFYLLHYVITKYKIPTNWLLPASLMIMVAHLTILNGNLPFVQENRNHLKIPFTAWIGYFAIAYIIGKHYQSFAKKIWKYKWLSLVGVAIAIFYFFMSYQSGNFRVASYRHDLFPLVLAIIVAVFAWGQLVPNLKVINLISNYSFGIYLVHWQVQRFLAPYVAPYFEHTSTRVIGLFFITLAVSIVIIKIIHALPFGSYIVGNVKRRVGKRKAGYQVEPKAA